LLRGVAETEKSSGCLYGFFKNNGDFPKKDLSPARIQGVGVVLRTARGVYSVLFTLNLRKLDPSTHVSRMADARESSIQACIDTEWKRLHVSKERLLYLHQLRVLELIARRQHVILQAPTGSGKSTPLFLGARVMRSLNKLGFYGDDGFPDDCRVITLIIQPFTALLKSTVKAANDMGFNAAFIGSEQPSKAITRSVQRGEVDIVCACPETLNNKEWRTIFAKPPWNTSVRVIGLDEGHMFLGEDWRPDYTKMSQLRGVFPHAVWLVCSATFYTARLKVLTRKLCLPNYELVNCSPNRPEIFYNFTLKTPTSDDIVRDLFLELKRAIDDGDLARFPRTIVWPGSIKKMVAYYDLAFRILNRSMQQGDGPRDPKQLIVTMYHAAVNQDMRDHILLDFLTSDGIIKLLIASPALSMGVDCQGVERCVFVGLPKKLYYLIQAIGRIRAAKSATVLIIANLGDAPKRASTEDQLRTFVQSRGKECVRRALLRPFVTQAMLDDKNLMRPVGYEHDHSCCNFCKASCLCPVCEAGVEELKESEGPQIDVPSEEDEDGRDDEGEDACDDADEDEPWGDAEYLRAFELLCETSIK
jgi:superfamily II DNA helicase RecQ